MAPCISVEQFSLHFEREFEPGEGDSTLIFRKQRGRYEQLLYEGLSAKEIAQQVEISHRTVEHRIERMKARIGARTISQLVALSIASGLTGKIPGN